MKPYGAHDFLEYPTLKTYAPIALEGYALYQGAGCLIDDTTGKIDESRAADWMDDPLPQTVGIDFSKAALDVFAPPAGCERQFTYTPKGHRVLICAES